MAWLETAVQGRARPRRRRAEPSSSAGFQRGRAGAPELRRSLFARTGRSRNRRIIRATAQRARLRPAPGGAEVRRDAQTPRLRAPRQAGQAGARIAVDSGACVRRAAGVPAKLRPGDQRRRCEPIAVTDRCERDWPPSPERSACGPVRALPAAAGVACRVRHDGPGRRRTGRSRLPAGRARAGDAGAACGRPVAARRAPTSAPGTFLASLGPGGAGDRQRRSPVSLRNLPGTPVGARARDGPGKSADLLLAPGVPLSLASGGRQVGDRARPRVDLGVGERSWSSRLGQPRAAHPLRAMLRRPDTACSRCATTGSPPRRSTTRSPPAWGLPSGERGGTGRAQGR